MPNALNLSTPPPPDMPQAQPQGMGAASSQNPAPSHEQTVAALRHFRAVSKELRVLLQNPDLGKSDLKSDIIDGFSKLVGDEIIPAAQAATLLGQMPERPFEQKQWLTKMFVQNMQAQVSVLAHHQRGGNTAPDWQTASQNDTTNSHMETMKGVMGHYGGMR